MNLLLTGATGFVGRNFLLHAIRSGRYEKIFLPLRSPEKLRAQLVGDGWDGIPTNVQTLTWSARDPLPEVPDPITDVVHCAGLLFGRTEQEFFETNVDATLRLLEKCQGAQRIALLSSQAAAGPCLDASDRTELEVESPVTPYGRSKLAMEQAVLKTFSHLPLVILRPPWILGARDTSTLPLFKMARFPVRFKPGRREKAYSYIAVTDLVAAINQVLTASVDLATLAQRIFFVAQRDIVSDKQMIQTAAAAVKRMGITIFVPQPVLKGLVHTLGGIPWLREAIPILSREKAPEIWPDRWVISPRRFEMTFQWKAQVELDTAMQETKDWYSRSGML
ncbi:MAG: NAD-dependent epimerase/dehydratase family protein [Deltaproteobacteria bacterium]|nr:NAD-dependent epimerase/dehydratase family protein [Deltaproteobacteria bacterium]MBI3295359.1 NAD-dependent epimerase/dehydratase family protein [Deltaproteobacteria bacterium]